MIFFYKLKKNPNMKEIFFVGGGGGGGVGVNIMNTCFKWHFNSSRRTPVPNYSEIHA